MERAVRSWLVLFGVVVAGIAVAHLLFGQSTYIGGGRVNATMDSDLRFFNVLFLAYGIGFVWAAQDLARRRVAVDLLGLLFLLGGLARALAWAASGPPSVFYRLMIVVELVVPVVNFVLVRRVTEPSPAQAASPRQPARTDGPVTGTPGQPGV